LIKGEQWEFSSSLNANASHSWNIGLNQDITGLLQIKQQFVYIRRDCIELIFIKVYRIKTHLEEQIFL
jgi:hypothetical protein